MFIVNVAEGEKKNPLHTRLFSLSIPLMEYSFSEEHNCSEENHWKFRRVKLACAAAWIWDS